MHALIVLQEMKRILVTLVLGVCGAALTCSATPVTKARELFEQCSRKEFIEDTNPRMQTIEGGLQVPLLSTGHTADLGDGVVVDFDVLMYQSELIAKEGMAAFDEVFTHLDDEQDYMRCIAFEALVRITQMRPEGYYFGRPGGAFDGNREWCERTRQTWKEWKAEQAAP